MVQRVQLLAVLLIALFFGTVFSNGISYINASVEYGEGYDQGYALGCYNVKLSDPNIKKPAKPEDIPGIPGNSYMNGYNAGYYDGFTECSSISANPSESAESLDTRPAESPNIQPPSSQQGGIDWIALAGGGTLLLSLPLPLVIAALQILEEPTGCGGIVE